MAIPVVLAAIGLIAFSVWYDKHRQKVLNTEGGVVGVVNTSDHRVALQLFGHDASGVTVLSETMEPQTEWKIRERISKAEVSAFPPKGLIDSALLVFDDSVSIWHKGEYPWDVQYGDHFIHCDVHWWYRSIPVVIRWRGPTLYRPARIYSITNDDYERALMR